MEAEKTLMKKDLALILKIDKRMVYGDIENVKKIHDAILERGMFHTVLGTRYIKKLEQILQGMDSSKCLFCGKQIENPNKTVLCNECTEKFMKPSSQSEQTKSDTVISKVEKSSVKTEKESVSTKADDKNIPSTATSEKTKSKKKIIIGVIITLFIIGMLSAIGFGKVFTVLMLISLGYLIYVCVKKKPKRNAIITFAILFVLTGTANMNLSDSKADFVHSNVNVNTFLSQYEETMNASAKDISDSEFTVKFVSFSKEENRETFQIQILDTDCGSIQLVCDEKNNITSIMGYTARNDSLGAFLMINLVRTIQSDLSTDEAEALIADSQMKNIGDTYNIVGDYAYSYFNDSDGLMLMIISKDSALETNK